MKKLIVFIGLMVSVFLLINCSNVAGTDGDNEDINNEQLAKVIIPLPKEIVARGIDLTESQGNTNFYEVTFKRTDSESPAYYSANATTDDQQIEVNIPAGTYDAVLFCGYKAGSNIPLLLATSSVSNNVIALEQTNTINMTLTITDVSINSSTATTIGDNITVSATATLTPFVYYSYSRLTVHDSGNNQIGGEIWNNTNGGPQPSIVGNAYTFSYGAITAPLSPCNIEIRLYGQCYPFTSSRTLWNLADSGSSALGQYYKQIITVAAGTGLPQVGINIIWPQA
jgi:hypothetical protein